MKKVILCCFFLINLFIAAGYAFDSFTVKKIDIEGLQGISADTVYTYLPIKTGQTLSADKTTAIIRDLYNTGFFDHISLARRGNTLVIIVVERPTIGQLKITGNSVIAKDKLDEVMRSVNVVEGRIYDRAILDKIQQSLLNQYYQLGRYNARVDVDVAPMGRNRVRVTITISEGLVAKVKGINIIGNKAFKESTLEKQLLISPSSLWKFTIFTQKDRYSQEKLDQSSEALRNYYLDRGYLKCAVTSSQVTITPDRKAIYITLVIHEGEQYKVQGVELVGNTIVPRETMLGFIKIKSGDYFSRQAILDAEKAMSDALGEKGYIYAQINVDPVIDDAQKTVVLRFNVNPGKEIYVRHIVFSDNNKTNDEVLRREMDQMEASLVSTKKLQQSKQQLSRLPYMKDVQMSVQPVPGTDDQVDVNYKVTEDSGGQINFNIGYSQLDHLILGAGINQKNFLGTGNTLGLNASRSRFAQNYAINYTNPYYTMSGISRSLSMVASTFNPGNANITGSYTMNQLSASDVYGIPLGQEQGIFNNLQLGYGLEDYVIALRDSSSPVSQQVNDFVNRNGRHFQQLDIITGFSRDSRDKIIFPTSGILHALSANIYAPINGQSLEYYTLDYATKWYHPLTEQFITVARSEVGFGSSFNGGAENYPFFKNFYAGGMSSVHGYTDNTLGPKDSNLDPTGGNLLVDASIGLIFPNHISDNVRTTVFVDGGNVYNTFNNRNLGGTASGSLRYAYGVEADVLLPMLGLIDVSLSKAVNPVRATSTQSGKMSDDTSVFQFALGANFG